MKPIVLDYAQKSPEWFAVRLGRLTGSVAGDMLATIKSGEAAARRDLRVRLVTERLTGRSEEDGYTNAAMQRGTELEAVARSRYEAVSGLLVQSSGFLKHPELMAGCSLDGHVGDLEGIIEIKCPKSATHLGYLRSNEIPANHRPQILHNLWISGAQWCDFVSFDDRFPDDMQLVIRRVLRDDKAISEYADKARAFLLEVEHEYQSLFGWKAGAA